MLKSDAIKVLFAWSRNLTGKTKATRAVLAGVPARTGMRATWTLLWLLLAGGARLMALDLGKAVVVTPANLSRPEQKAITMLVEEVEKRSGIRWEVKAAFPGDGRPVVAVGQAGALRTLGGFAVELLPKNQTARPAEGFHLRARPGANPVVLLAGNDPRGVLFGVGFLLRQLHLAAGSITLADDLDITTAPKYPLRGHQLGYRPKTNSYDAWDLATWEQYYRDLIIFGANAIELIPPRSDDDADSPHFPVPPMPMMANMSRLADDYGVDVWIWYPAMDADYGDPKTVEFALKEWAAVFEKLPRIDAVFVPGGDPGHTRPRHLLALLEKQTESLHRTHPQAQMWVSPQSFNQEWLDEFLDILKREQPAWLSGVVFGPQVRISLPELRAAVPAKYPIRHYPDITHSRQCQYPVPDWDTAYALTLGRECINPRPLDQAAIFRLLQPHTLGFLTYSEGCNDDVNKAVWSALGWNPDQPVIDILREFSRYFISDRNADSFAQGLLALERNWRGPLIANEGVYTTLRQFQALERAATPAELGNWRFQQALFRAYYDAYTRARLIQETTLEEKAVEKLRAAGKSGAEAALTEAGALLQRATTEPAAPDWRARIFELGDALFKSIRMQLSVSRHKAISLDRGTSLDTVDVPLNNAPWLQAQFASIRKLPNEAGRLQAIERIVNWTDPGPGGFYDDTGNVARQPHVVRGLPFEQDPASLRSSKIGFKAPEVAPEGGMPRGNALRYAWYDHAESLVDQPLKMRYTGLDPAARYQVRVMYVGEGAKRDLRLVANEQYEVHPFIPKPFPYQPLEFDVPAGATRGGNLELTWSRERGLGGNGRGCQVAEVWLIKK